MSQIDTTRRNLLKIGATSILTSQIPFFSIAKASAQDNFDYIITASEGKANLSSKKGVTVQGYNGQYPAPVLRAKQGERFRVKFINKLAKPSTIHWHGIRIVNEMDGVPFLTQKPVMPGESFIYDFVCPDAGTFWYHTHANSVEQLSKGLCGCLIVEEKEKQNFDKDVLLQLKRWNLDKDGNAKTIFSMKHAGRNGSVGYLHTVNGKDEESISVQPGENIRLRFANIDNSLVYGLRGFNDFDATLLAIDAVPVSKSHPLANGYELGSGSRIDVSLHIPKDAKPGKKTIYYKHGRKTQNIISISVTAPAKNKPLSDRKITSLPQNPVSIPDMENIEKNIPFRFEWSGNISPSESKDNVKFWAINKTSWEAIKDGKIPPPLATLKHGKTYQFTLTNDTPNQHPVHMHGLFFRVDKSNKKKIVPYFADTVLLDKNETVTLSLVADNKGRWMFHCHIIEHMKTGFMGYITIT